MTPRLILAAAAVLLLAGCTATPVVVQPTPEPTSAPQTRTAAVPDVPLTSGRITAARTVVPPMSVEVPAAGIVVSVVPVGVQPDGLMELPEDVAVSGWYRYGSDPLGPTGTTVIAAHVDSNVYGLGPFAGLKGLAAGTEVVVTVADGRQVRYQIQSVTNVPKDQLTSTGIFDREGDRRLALITCGGQFDYSASSYSDNIVVIATPVAP